jgi:Fe/S biogenesis protein NfuA|tara:strand:+ start:666 stop:1241 length:576 start_codon:yes stop_codon:yes gene_type:complete
MFTISKEAETYIADLFEQQDEELGLKVEVEKVGTPIANVTFNFCRPADMHKKYEKFPYKGFDVYVAVTYIEALEGADVALKIDGTAKKLTITAPNAKGDAPGKDSPLIEKVQYTLLTEISPRLASHGGYAELVEITDKKEVILNFGGGCQGCSSVAITLKDGIEQELMGLYPEIIAILDVTDHSNKENAYM